MVACFASVQLARHLGNVLRSNVPAGLLVCERSVQLFQPALPLLRRQAPSGSAASPPASRCGRTRTDAAAAPAQDHAPRRRVCRPCPGARVWPHWTARCALPRPPVAAGQCCRRWTAPPQADPKAAAAGLRAPSPAPAGIPQCRHARRRRPCPRGPAAAPRARPRAATLSCLASRSRVATRERRRAPRGGARPRPRRAAGAHGTADCRRRAARPRPVHRARSVATAAAAVTRSPATAGDRVMPSSASTAAAGLRVLGCGRGRSRAGHHAQRRKHLCGAPVRLLNWRPFPAACVSQTVGPCPARKTWSHHPSVKNVLFDR